jgi:hypothetical protein
MKCSRDGTYKVVSQYFTSDGKVQAQVLLDLSSNDFVAETIYEDTGRTAWSLHFLQQCAEKVCEDFIKNPF